MHIIDPVYYFKGEIITIYLFKSKVSFSYNTLNTAA